MSLKSRNRLAAGFDRWFRRRGGPDKSQYMMTKAVVEALESRILLSTFQVTNTYDVASGGNYVGSLRWAVNEANEYASSGPNIIDFASNVTGTITLGTGLGLGDMSLTAGNTTIEGPGAGVLSISGNNATLVLNVAYNATVEVENLTVTHGYHLGNAGAISDNGNLTLLDCDVTYSSSQHGGGIDDDGTLTVIGSSFNHDSATVAGGALSIEDGASVTVSESTISGNTSEARGGGIYNNGNLTVNESTAISDNTAQIGGGVFMYGNVTVNDSSISGNSASERGGGIYAQGTLDATDSTLYRNSASQGGGAIYNYIGGTTLTGCTITYNSANNGGGVDNADGGTVTVADSQLNHNSAAQGAAINNVLSGPLTISNSTLSGNVGSENGGAIFDYNSDAVNIYDSTITGNTADGVGGGIYVGSGSVLNVASSTIGQNIAAGYGGGGIYNMGTLNLTDCTISGNSALNGGGIYNQQVGTVLVYGSTFIANTAYNTGNGGGGIGDAGQLTVVNSLFAQNHASNGGAINDNGDFGFQITNSTLYDNTAHSDGGGICGTGVITDCTISHNSSASANHAGGLQTDESTINGTIIVGNTNTNGASDLSAPPDSGSNNLIGSGAGTFSGSNNTFGVTTSMVKLSPLGYYGGPTETMALLPGSDAIGAGYAGVATDQRGLLRPGSAGYDIGAFQTDPLVVNTAQDGPTGFGYLSLREAVNLADALGGTPTITFSSTVFAPGSMHTIDLLGYGNPLNLDGSGTVTIQGPGDNVLTINGQGTTGVFVITSGSANISGLTITGGGSGSIGGGGINDSSSNVVNVSDSIITGNNTSNSGGGVYNGGAGTLNLTDCTISANTALTGGGVCDIQGTLNITNCTISGNSATTGGAIYLNSYSRATVTNSTISGNSADSNGGGIYNNGYLTVLNCLVNQNHAVIGAGIRNNDGNGDTLAITNSTLYGNVATGAGGGIDGDATIIDCTISGNSASGTNAGGGIHGYNGTKLSGTIVAGNTIRNSTTPSDIASSSLVSGGTNSTYNLIGTGGAGGLANGGTSHNILLNSLSTLGLASLGNYGGPTETMALLPGSPAIDAGFGFTGITADQRDVSRPQGAAPDIGAFESQGFNVSVLAGNSQSVPFNTPFSDLAVHVTSNDPNLTNLSGGIITFTATPGSNGDSAILSAGATPNVGTATLNSAGNASIAATANGSYSYFSNSNVVNYYEATRRPYNVVASTGSNIGTHATTTFSLTNLYELLNLTATATTNGNIDLRWVDDSQASEYQIFRGNSPTSMSIVDTVTAPAPSNVPSDLTTVFSDTSTDGLQPNTTYYYQIEAVNSDGFSYTYPYVVSATTATGTGYSSTPLMNGNSTTTTFTANEVSVVPTSQNVTTPVLSAGVHYEIVASGDVISSGSTDGGTDAQYGYAPGTSYDPGNQPVSNASFLGGYSDNTVTWQGDDFVDFGLGINDSALTENKYPYWGNSTWNGPTSPGTYSIDVVGTGTALHLTYHDDLYPYDSVGNTPLQVEIFQALSGASSVSQLTATAVPLGNGVTAPETQLRWAYTPPNSGSLTMLVMRAPVTNGGVGSYSQIDSVTVTGLTNGNPIGSFLDNTTGLTANQQYAYQILISGESGSGTTSNVATVTTAAAVSYASTAADTISIPVDGSTVSSHIILQPGVHYELEASGTTTLNAPGGGTETADAEYVFPGGTADSNGLSPGYVDDGIGIDDANTAEENKYADWGWNGPSSSNTYFIDVVGQGQTLNFTYHSDLTPASNAANLQVQIFPTVPTLTSAALDGSQPPIDLAWTDPTGGQTGFTVERSTDGVNFSPIANGLPSNQLTYDDTSPITGQTNYYEIIATGPDGNIGSSNVLSVAYPSSSPQSGSISGNAYNLVTSTDPPVGAGRVPITDPVTFTNITTSLNTAGLGSVPFAIGNTVAPYAPDDSLLVTSNNDDSNASEQYIFEISSTGVVSLFADLGIFTADRPSDVAASESMLSVAQPGNPAGFTAGDVFYTNGNTGQIIRLTDGGKKYVNDQGIDSLMPPAGQTIPAWVTLPTDHEIIGELFLDNSGSFGGDLVVSDAVDHIFLIDPSGNYTQIDAVMPVESGNAATRGGASLVALPDDTARWGPFAGTILLFPQTPSPSSTNAYNAYDLSLTNLTPSTTPTQLSVAQIPLIPDSADSTNSEEDRLGDASNATLIPTNANLYAVDAADGTGVISEASYETDPAADFNNIAGDILLAQEGGGGEHFFDIYYNPSGEGELTAKNIPSNYTAATGGNGLSSVDGADFGPSIAPPGGANFTSATITTPAAGREVYLDTNDNGQWDPGEPITTTAADGSYSFNNLPALLAGTSYQVGEVLASGEQQVTPAHPEQTVTVVSNQATTGVNFDTRTGVGEFPPVFTTTPTSTAAIGTLYSSGFTVSDPNPGATISYDLPEHPAGMYIDQTNPAEPRLVWNVPANPTEFGRVLVRATDSYGLSAILPLTISLTTGTAVTGVTVYGDGNSTDGDADAIELSWNAYTGVSGVTPVYYIQRSTDPNFTGLTSTLGPDWIPMNSTHGFDVVSQNGQEFAEDSFFNTYSDNSTQLTPSSGPYYYRIMAGFGGDGTDTGSVVYTSAPSWVAASPPPPSAAVPTGSTTPGAPNGLTATLNTSTGAITLEWFKNADSATTGYEIFRSDNLSTPIFSANTSSNAFGTPSDRNPDSAYSWTDTSPVDGQTYSYWVYGITASGSPLTVTATSANHSNVATLNSLPSPSAPNSLNPSGSWVGTNYTEMGLSATANDPSGDGLTFYWSLASGPGIAPTIAGGNVAIGENGVAGNPLDLVFHTEGIYTFDVTAMNVDGTSLPTTLTIDVPQIASNSPAIVISPATPQLAPNATELFTAMVYDQFNNAISPSNVGISWSLSASGNITTNSDGSIASDGIYTETTGSNTVWAEATTPALAANNGSPAVPATTVDASTTITPLTTYLPAPAGLTALAIGETQVQLSWTEVANASSYLITRINPDNTVTTIVPTNLHTSGSTFVYDDPTLTGPPLAIGKSYTYYVQAVDASGAHSGGVANALSPASQAAATTWSVPPTPTGLTATAVSNTEIDLTWNASLPGSHVIGYDVLQAWDGSDFTGPYVYTSVLPAGQVLTTPVFDDKNLGPNTQLSFEVVAITRADLNQGSLPSAPASASIPPEGQSVNPVPQGPTSLTAAYAGSPTTAGPGDVDLEWTAPSGTTPVVQYDIYRSADPNDVLGSIPGTNTPGGMIASTTNTYYVDNTVPLAGAPTYYYRVIAVINGPAGPEDTDPSPMASTPTSSTAPPVPFNAPTVTSLASDHVSLEWNYPPTSSTLNDVQGFEILRSGSLYGTVGPDTTTFTDDNVTPGTTYSYQIEAFNYPVGYPTSPTSPNTYLSNAASAMVPTLATGSPNPPTVLAATATAFAVTLTWSAPNTGPTPSGYFIYRQTPLGSWLQLNATADLTTSYTDSANLSPATSYNYVVRSEINGMSIKLSAPSSPPFGATTMTASPQLSLTPIANPGDGNPYAQIPTLSSPTNIIGVASDGAGGLTNWTLTLIPEGSTTNLNDIVVASGTTSVGSPGSPGSPGTTGTFTTFDPALYPTGNYKLDLSGKFNGGETANDATTQIAIASHIQLGNFTLPVTDMTVNVPGQSPIVIGRTYDSTKASDLESFGYGWQLNVLGSQITTSNGNAPLTFGNLVYITLPDGEQHVFQFIPAFIGGPDSPYEPGTQLNPVGGIYDSDEGEYVPQFVCVDGSNATLTVPANSSLGSIQLAYSDPAGGGTGQFIDIATDQPYNPQTNVFGNAYTLTTADGTSYQFEASTGQVDSVADPNGNKTTYTYFNNGGMSISAGGVTVTVTTSTDNPSDLNLIQDISVNGVANETVSYGYDANGNLTSVTQPQTSPNSTFTNVYSSPTLHYLTSVKNALGATVITIGYDPNTNLFDLVESAGNSSQTSTIQTTPTAGLASTSQTITDPQGNTTEEIYDSEGDVIRKIQTNISDGVITGYTVTCYNFTYQTFMDLQSAVQNGVAGENQLLGETDWVPFTISGTDSAGLRYSQQPTQVAKAVSYYPEGQSLPPADVGQIESVSVLGASGAMQTTGYPNYVNGMPQTVVDPQGNTTANTYDGDRNLLTTKETDSKGNVLSYTTYTYSDGTDGVPAGLVVETDSLGPTGQLIRESYNTYYGNSAGNAAHPYIVAIPTGTPNEAGELASTTNVSGVTTYYAYDEMGNQVLSYTPRVWTPAGGTTAEHGWDVTVTQYDLAGRVTNTYQGTYLGTGTPAYSITATNSSPGVFNDTTNLLYDDATQSAYASGTPLLQESQTVYNAAGQVASTTDQYGGVTQNFYDADGNLVETLYPDGTATRTAYDSLNRPVLTMDKFYLGTNATGSAPTGIDGTETFYNSLGQVESTERVSGAQINIAANNSPVQFYNVTVASDGTPFSSTSTTYNADGTVASTTSTDEAVGSTPDSSTLTTLYTYYPDGQQASVTQENVPVWNGTADVLENLTTSYFYNSQGQQSETIDPLGNVTSYEYDSLGRLITTGYSPVSNDGSSTLQSTETSETYDSAGNKASETDQLGRVTSYKYDDAGDLIEVDQPAVPNPSNTAQMVTPVTKYTFDNFGDELTQTDANADAGYTAHGTTTYTYDENGNMLTETLPNSESESWTYNQFGQVATQTDFDGDVAAYTYFTSGANAGKEEEVVYTGSGKTTQTVNYTYDNLGRQSTVVDLTGTTTYSYDANSNLIEENTPEGIVNYVYNSLNQMIETWTGTTHSSATTDTLYTYDDLGRLSSVTETKLNGSSVNLVTTYGYDGNGNKVYESDPNGDVTNYTYDVLNRLTGETVTHTVSNTTTTLYSVAYTLNADGTRATATETELQSGGGSPATINTTWGYDAEDRLTSESISSSLTNQSLGDTYTYDLDGNRLKDVHTGPGNGASGTTTYSYNSDNELTGQTLTVSGTPTSTTFSYDANGSQTGSTSGSTITTYTYDVRNKMASYSVTGGSSASYVYDDAGNRVQEKIGTTTSYYLTDTNNPTGYAEPIEVKTYTGSTPTLGAAAMAMTYLIGDHVFGQVDSSSNISYLVTDGHGSTREIVSTAGTVITTLNYDNAGDPDGFTLSSLTPIFTFGGDAVQDYVSGLYFNGDGVRPRTGYRFIQMDPTRGNRLDPLSEDLYLYGNANSVSGFDPSGHDDLAELLVGVSIDATLETAQLSAVGNAAEEVVSAARAVSDAGIVEYLEAFGLSGVLTTVSTLLANVPAGGTHFARLPDYFAANVSFDLGPSLSETITIDRYGNWYYSLLGIGFGLSPTVVGLSVSADWLNQSTKPTPARLHSFLTTNGFSVGAGYWGGVSESWTPGVGTATGLGFFSPQVGGSYTYSFQGPGKTGLAW
jgi:YD repeat-containing protein